MGRDSRPRARARGARAARRPSGLSRWSTPRAAKPGAGA